MASYCTSVLLKLANHDDHLARANDWVAKDSDESKAGTLNPGQVSFYNQTGETFKIAAIRTVLNDLAYAGFRGQKRWCVLLHFDKPPFRLKRYLEASGGAASRHANRPHRQPWKTPELWCHAAW